MIVVQTQNLKTQIVVMTHAQNIQAKVKLRTVQVNLTNHSYIKPSMFTKPQLESTSKGRVLKLCTACDNDADSTKTPESLQTSICSIVIL